MAHIHHAYQMKNTLKRPAHLTLDHAHALCTSEPTLFASTSDPTLFASPCILRLLAGACTASTTNSHSVQTLNNGDPTSLPFAQARTGSCTWPALTQISCPFSCTVCIHVRISFADCMFRAELLLLLILLTDGQVWRRRQATILMHTHRAHDTCTHMT